MRHRAPWAFTVGLLVACGRPPVQAPRPSAPTAQVTSSAPPAGTTLLMDTARVATGVHAGPLQVIGAGARRAGESLDGFVYVPAQRCALVYGRSGDSVVDLDLHAFSDDGTQFGVDEASDDLPTLMLCTGAKAERLFVSARVAQGQGFVALGMHDVALDKRDEVAQAVGAGNRNSKFEPNATVWPALDASLAEHRQALGASWTDLRRVALPVDARLPTSVDAEIPAGRCLDILALPDDPYLQVDLSVVTEEGRVVSRGRDRGDERSSLICSPKRRQRVHIELRPQSGQGLVLLALSVSELGGARRINSSVENLPVLLQEPRRIEAPHSAPLVRRRALRLFSGQLHRSPYRLRGCELLSLHSVSSQTFHLRLWDKTGREIAATPPAGSTSLIACGSGELDLEVEAARTEDVELRTYRLSQTSALDTQDAQVLNLALNRLAEELPVQQLTHPTQVSSRNLPSGQLTPLSFEVPSATCTVLALATRDDTGSLDLRLVEEDAARSMRAQASPVASLRVCNSGPQGVPHHFNLRRAGPDTEALILVYEQPLGPARTEE